MRKATQLCHINVTLLIRVTHHLNSYSWEVIETKEMYNRIKSRFLEMKRRKIKTKVK